MFGAEARSSPRRVRTSPCNLPISVTSQASCDRRSSSSLVTAAISLALFSSWERNPLVCSSWRTSCNRNCSSTHDWPALLSSRGRTPVCGAARVDCDLRSSASGGGVRTWSHRTDPAAPFLHRSSPRLVFGQPLLRAPLGEVAPRAIRRRTVFDAEHHYDFYLRKRENPPRGPVQGHLRRFGVIHETARELHVHVRGPFRCTRVSAANQSFWRGSARIASCPLGSCSYADRTAW